MLAGFCSHCRVLGESILSILKLQEKGLTGRLYSVYNITSIGIIYVHDRLPCYGFRLVDHFGQAAEKAGRDTSRTMSSPKWEFRWNQKPGSLLRGTEASIISILMSRNAHALRSRTSKWNAQREEPTLGPAKLLNTPKLLIAVLPTNPSSSNWTELPATSPRNLRKSAQTYLKFHAKTFEHPRAAGCSPQELDPLALRRWNLRLQILELRAVFFKDPHLSYCQYCCQAQGTWILHSYGLQYPEY